MTLSMRHATWQQLSHELSHESRAAINAIVDIRRMHLIAKIKTYTNTHKKHGNKKIKENMKSHKSKASEKRVQYAHIGGHFH